MNDYIERKKAIERIQPHVKPQTVYGEGYLQAIEHATEILKLIPAAEVQHVKHGEWIKIYPYQYPYQYKCSLCGAIIWLRVYLLEDYKFCWHCGAKMDGESE